MRRFNRPVEILLVEDNPGDIRLISEALKEDCKRPHELNVARDGMEALAFLRHQGKYGEARRPDLILLDLNLPKKHGLDVLKEVKGDPALKGIPVVVLTSSANEEDVRRSYELNANCYTVKQIELDEYITTVKSIRDFWFETVNLPPAYDL